MRSHTAGTGFDAYKLHKQPSTHSPLNQRDHDYAYVYTNCIQSRNNLYEKYYCYHCGVTDVLVHNHKIVNSWM